MLVYDKSRVGMLDDDGQSRGIMVAFFSKYGYWEQPNYQGCWDSEYEGVSPDFWMPLPDDPVLVDED